MADYSIDITIENEHSPNDTLLGHVMLQIPRLVSAGASSGRLTYLGAEVGHWDKKEF